MKQHTRVPVSESHASKDENDDIQSTKNVTIENNDRIALGMGNLKNESFSMSSPEVTQNDSAVIKEGDQQVKISTSTENVRSDNITLATQPEQTSTELDTEQAQLSDIDNVSRINIEQSVTTHDVTKYSEKDAINEEASEASDKNGNELTPVD